MNNIENMVKYVFACHIILLRVYSYIICFIAVTFLKEEGRYYSFHMARREKNRRVVDGSIEREKHDN